jgi:hypothetical protein
MVMLAAKLSKASGGVPATVSNARSAAIVVVVVVVVVDVVAAAVVVGASMAMATVVVVASPMSPSPAEHPARIRINEMPRAMGRMFAFR